MKFLCTYQRDNHGDVIDYGIYCQNLVSFNCWNQFLSNFVCIFGARPDVIGQATRKEGRGSLGEQGPTRNYEDELDVTQIVTASKPLNSGFWKVQEKLLPFSESKYIMACESQLERSCGSCRSCGSTCLCTSTNTSKVSHISDSLYELCLHLKPCIDLSVK